ncbi:MAG: hypothetical protein JWP29_3131, partial [Rhodoferax sp.]|nr:hypothetical protein [Rhodoferax sp.]
MRFTAPKLVTPGYDDLAQPISHLIKG